MKTTPVVREAKRLADAGSYGEAIELLRRHLADAGDDHVARNLLAFTYFKKGDFAAAEAQYWIMVARAKPDPRDLYSLARALEAQGKIKQAEVWKSAAVAADPDVGAAFGVKPQRPRHAPASEALPTRTRPPALAPSTVPMTELGIPTPRRISTCSRSGCARVRRKTS